MPVFFRTARRWRNRVIDWKYTHHRVWWWLISRPAVVRIWERISVCRCGEVIFLGGALWVHADPKPRSQSASCMWAFPRTTDTEASQS